MKVEVMLNVVIEQNTPNEISSNYLKSASKDPLYQVTGFFVLYLMEDKSQLCFVSQNWWLSSPGEPELEIIDFMVVTIGNFEALESFPLCYVVLLCIWNVWIRQGYSFINCLPCRIQNPM